VTAAESQASDMFSLRPFKWHNRQSSKGEVEGSSQQLMLLQGHNPSNEAVARKHLKSQVFGTAAAGNFQKMGDAKHFNSTIT
jgi:hypothetical protein